MCSVFSFCKASIKGHDALLILAKMIDVLALRLGSSSMPSENVLHPEGIWLSKILCNLFFKKCNQTPVYGHPLNTDTKNSLPCPRGKKALTVSLNSDTRTLSVLHPPSPSPSLPPPPQCSYRRDLTGCTLFLIRASSGQERIKKRICSQISTPGLQLLKIRWQGK